MDPKKCPMPTQDPNVRNKNFKEVALGYTEEIDVYKRQSTPSARLDLPEPDTPATPTILPSGTSTFTFFRLCTRAPRILIWSTIRCV